MKRILLKLSGEFLQGDQGVWSKDKVDAIVQQIDRLCKEGVQVAIVIGGGNIFRGGRNGFDFERCDGDGIGMAATCVNALFLKACLQKCGLEVVVCGKFLNGVDIVNLSAKELQERLNKGQVVIFSGGTGYAYFSTDTAAALRAIEIQADVLLKATKVDGVYDKDPERYSDAKKFDRLTYKEVCDQRYEIMDASAFSLCREQKMPIFIFNLKQKDAIYNAVHHTTNGTFIQE